MFVSFLVLALLRLNFLNAKDISEDNGKFLKSNRRHSRDYFPGVHQSINASGVTFTYNELDDYGPSNWGLTWPECDGDYQSPINIDDSFTKAGKAPPLYMNYFGKEVLAINVTNTGHTINFRLHFADKKPSRLYWNGDGKIYILDSIHLHWGLICGGGSEHTINGHRYAAEIHMVHYNQNYKNFTTAVLENDGIAVVAIFFELAEESTNDGSNDNKFLKFLGNVTNEGDSVLVTDKSGVFTIQELIKSEIKEYYSYKGSLTTPPCYETVRFIIAKKPVKIYPSELSTLSNIRGRFGQILRNYRPLQPINQRKIYDYNYKYKTSIV